MRILIVVDDYQDGAGNIAQLLALHLKKRKNEISILCTNNHSAPRYYLDGIQRYDKNFSQISGSPIKRFGLMLRCIRDTAKKARSKMIISFIDNNNTLSCFAFMFSKLPIIVSERSNPVAIQPEFPWNHLRRMAYRRADAVSVLFDSFTGFDYGRYLDKCIVTPNFVKEADCHKTDYSGGTTSFISCGRFAPIKRFDLMIEMFARAYEKNKTIDLHIYGSGQMRDRLQDRIATLGLEKVVSLHPYTENVYETLAKHDVYLMTSEQEGFPNALCEAMAAGLPVIAFCCHEGLRELVQDGENGFLIEDDSKDDFVETMIGLSENHEICERIGNEAKKITQIYSEQEVMKRWEMCIHTAKRQPM